MRQVSSGTGLGKIKSIAQLNKEQSSSDLNSNPQAALLLN